jgi:hypothetical protein
VGNAGERTRITAGDVVFGSIAEFSRFRIFAMPPIRTPGEAGTYFKPPRGQGYWEVGRSAPSMSESAIFAPRAPLGIPLAHRDCPDSSPSSHGLLLNTFFVHPFLLRVPWSLDQILIRCISFEIISGRANRDMFPPYR